MDCCTTDYPHGGHGHGRGHRHGHGHGRGRGRCGCGCDCRCCGGGGSSCGCDQEEHGLGGFRRRFISPQEELELLEEYLKELKNEIAGVEAEIKRLKKG